MHSEFKNRIANEMKKIKAMPNTESRTPELTAYQKELLGWAHDYVAKERSWDFPKATEALLANWMEIAMHFEQKALEAAPVDGTLVEALKDVRADIEACKKHNDKEGFSTRMSITMKGALAKVDAALAGAAHGWRPYDQKQFLGDFEQFVTCERTQKDFAEKHNISQAFLTDIMKGRRNCPNHILKAMGLERAVCFRSAPHSAGGANCIQQNENSLEGGTEK